MTEGNIANWKVKEGDSFSTGDVLLEIETDKATMDVEAQDDGILAKIFQDDGAKSVQVGTRIAVLADAGDDISSLEIPSEDKAKASAPKAQQEAPARSASDARDTPTPINDPMKPSKDEPSKSASPTPSGPGQNKKYPLYPSVAQLLREKHVTKDEIAKIPASGPQGRLLKGDVLAYLGDIDSDYSSVQSARIKHMQHLDLSNIKLGPPPSSKPAPPPASSSQPAPSAYPALAQTTEVAVSISLSQVLSVQQRIQDTLGVSIPLSTFLARATDVANDDLPRSKTTAPSNAELFDTVLGLAAIPKTTRGSFVPQITALPPPISMSSRHTVAERRPVKQPDIIDVLAGTPSSKSRAARRVPALPGGISAGKSEGAAMNVFSVTVPVGDEKRARTFLERVKSVLQVEPGQLVL